MSSQERRHRSYFVSGGSVDRRRATKPVEVVTPKVSEELCQHGVVLSRFCLPCADERSHSDRIDVV
jgi:Trm5-related predicted tRNA methylase